MLDVTHCALSKEHWRASKISQTPVSHYHVVHRLADSPVTVITAVLQSCFWLWNCSFPSGFCSVAATQRWQMLVKLLKLHITMWMGKRTVLRYVISDRTYLAISGGAWNKQQSFWKFTLWSEQTWCFFGLSLNPETGVPNYRSSCTSVTWSALRGIRIWPGNFSLEPSGQTACLSDSGIWIYPLHLVHLQGNKNFHPHCSKQLDCQWWCVHSRVVLTQNCWWLLASSSETNTWALLLISGACFLMLSWMIAPLEKS